MLDQLFVRQGVVARLRRSPLGPHLDPFATALPHTGYTTSSIQRFLCAAEKFAPWLHGHGYSVYEMDEDLVRVYLSGLPRHRGGSLPKAAQGLGHLVRFLQHRGGTHLRQDGLVITPLEEWLSAYDTHLAHVAGFARSTRQGYGHIVQGFLTACFGTEPPDWSTLTAAQITAFVSQAAAKRRNAGRKQPAAAVRSFLRFLVFRGNIPPGLEAAALAPPQWKYAALPSRLPPEEVARVLAVYHEGTASSPGNRAILCCLARLGLRTQDVVSLCFEDIDWAAGCLALRPGKTRRARRVPLPHDVGPAIVASRQNGRPQSASRQGFVQSRAPFRALTGAAVWAIVRHAFTRTESVVPPGVASQIFRQTVASQMVNRGASFKEVADV